MATQKIFAIDTRNEKVRVGNSMSTYYAYDASSKTLKVHWKNEEPVVLNGVSEGAPIWINCWGGVPEVKPIKLPRRKADCLAWLLDFPKEVRTHDRGEYEKFVKTQRSAYAWWGYREFTREAPGWAVTLCNRSDCGGVYRIACFISDEAASSKATVKDILAAWADMRGMRWPKTFVRNILRDRFGFTDDDLADVDDYLRD